MRPAYLIALLCHRHKALPVLKWNGKLVPSQGICKSRRLNWWPTVLSYCRAFASNLTLIKINPFLLFAPQAQQFVLFAVVWNGSKWQPQLASACESFYGQWMADVVSIFRYRFAVLQTASCKLTFFVFAGLVSGFVSKHRVLSVEVCLLPLNSIRWPIVRSDAVRSTTPTQRHIAWKRGRRCTAPSCTMNQKTHTPSLKRRYLFWRACPCKRSPWRYREQLCTCTTNNVCGHSVVETGASSSQVVRCQEGKKYRLPYVVYEKLAPW